MRFWRKQLRIFQMLLCKKNFHDVGFPRKNCKGGGGEKRYFAARLHHNRGEGEIVNHVGGISTAAKKKATRIQRICINFPLYIFSPSSPTTPPVFFSLFREGALSIYIFLVLWEKHLTWLSLGMSGWHEWSKTGPSSRKQYHYLCFSIVIVREKQSAVCGSSLISSTGPFAKIIILSSRIEYSSFSASCCCLSSSSWHLSNKMWTRGRPRSPTKKRIWRRTECSIFPSDRKTKNYQKRKYYLPFPGERRYDETECLTNIELD